LPLAAGRAGNAARLLRDHGVDRGGRDHGPRAQDAADRRRAVPSREHPYDSAWQGPRRQVARTRRASERRAMSQRPPFPEVFTRLEQGTLDVDAVRSAFAAIFAGDWTAVQIGAFATALRLRGESPSVIVAAAE